MRIPFVHAPHHEHEFIVIGSAEHARIDDHDPVKHTAFRLRGCVICKAVECWPRENFNLTTPLYREWLKAELRASGWMRFLWEEESSSVR